MTPPVAASQRRASRENQNARRSVGLASHAPRATTQSAAANHAAATKQLQHATSHRVTASSNVTGQVASRVAAAGAPSGSSHGMDSSPGSMSSQMAAVRACIRILDTVQAASQPACSKAAARRAAKVSTAASSSAALEKPISSWTAFTSMGTRHRAAAPAARGSAHNRNNRTGIAHARLAMRLHHEQPLRPRMT